MCKTKQIKPLVGIGTGKQLSISQQTKQRNKLSGAEYAAFFWNSQCKCCPHIHMCAVPQKALEVCKPNFQKIVLTPMSLAVHSLNVSQNPSLIVSDALCKVLIQSKHLKKNLGLRIVHQKNRVLAFRWISDRLWQ